MVGKSKADRECVRILYSCAFLCRRRKKMEEEEKKRKKKEHRHALKDSRHLLLLSFLSFLFSSLSLFSLFSLSLVAQVYFFWRLNALSIVACRMFTKKEEETYAHTKRNIKSARRDDLFVKAMKRGRGTLEDAENNDDEEEAFSSRNFAEGEQEQEQEENERSNIAPHERKQHYDRAIRRD